MRARALQSGLLVALVAVAAATAHAAPTAVDSRIEAVIESYRTDGAQQALPKFEALLPLFGAPAAARDRAAVMHYIGECHWRLGRFDIARRTLDKALQLERSIGDRHLEGKTLNTIGLLEWDQGRYEAAMSRFRSAGAIAREVGDRKLEGSSLNNSSLVLDELGEYDTALRQYHQVLEIYKSAGFPRGEGDTLGNIGGVHLLLGDFQEALRYYRRALRISEQLGSKAAMGQDHGNIALCLLGLGEVDEALSHLDRAIEFAQQTGMQQDQAYWTREKGNAFVQKGQYGQALRSHRAALAIYEKLGATAEQLESLHDNGRLHLLLGDYSSAEGDLKQALQLARTIGFDRGETHALLALGDLQARRQEWSEAATYYEQSRQRASTAKQQDALARALLSLAEAQRTLQRLDQADISLKEASDIARKIGSRQLEARAELLAGKIHLERGKPRAGLLALDASRRTIAPIGDPELLWQIDLGRARALEALGDLPGAVAALESAGRVIESVRGRLLEQRFRSGYIEDKFEVYRELLRLQLKQGQVSEAFSTAERLRARAYIEQLGGRYSYKLTDAERQQEAQLRSRIRQLQEGMTELDQDGNPAYPSRAVNRFSEELVRAEREYQAFLDDHTRAATGDASAAPAAASAVRKRLPPGTAVLEYIVGPSSTVAFVITSIGITAHTLPVTQASLEARIALLGDLVVRRDSEEWKKPASKLHSQLIAPLEAEGALRGVRGIYVVPHGPLNHLSFALLTAGSAANPTLMVDKYTLAYLPAASVLLQPEIERQAPRTLLALAPARSRLRFAEVEAKSVEALYRPRSRLLVGAAATETRFKDDAENYQLLHIATHGYFDQINPLLSGLELEADGTNDGRLQAHEVLGLRLRASLVTLSACDTALGGGYFSQLPIGDEFVGMARAFLIAGSGAVLAALWRVDDQSSVTVMERFYKQLEPNGSFTASPAALARAQRELRQRPELQHPFYWAAYVVVGPMGRVSDNSNQRLGRTS